VPAFQWWKQAISSRQKQMVMAAKKKRAKQKKTRPRVMFDDPYPPDKNDPVFREEMFDLYQSQEMKPEELDDEEERRLYADWLKKQ
jgi:hypothetical protein